MPLDHETRQVFDIPSLKIEVIEYRAPQKTCPHCRQTSVATFPSDVQYPRQYGNRVKALSTYLNQYQLLPYE